MWLFTGSCVTRSCIRHGGSPSLLLTNNDSGELLLVRSIPHLWFLLWEGLLCGSVHHSLLPNEWTFYGSHFFFYPASFPFIILGALPVCGPLSVGSAAAQEISRDELFWDIRPSLSRRRAVTPPIDLKLHSRPAIYGIHHFIYETVLFAAVLLGQVLGSRLPVSVVFQKRFHCSGGGRPADSFSIDALDKVVPMDNEHARHSVGE